MPVRPQIVQIPRRIEERAIAIPVARSKAEQSQHYTAIDLRPLILDVRASHGDRTESRDVPGLDLELHFGPVLRFMRVVRRIHGRGRVADVAKPDRDGVGLVSECETTESGSDGE